MLSKSASRGKIFANEPNLLRVVAWGFWIPMGHYYQQMWIKCFSWVFLTFRCFWVCWTDVIFCRGQTHLSDFYFSQNLFNMLIENIFMRYLCTCISFFCPVPYHKTKNYFITVGFVLLPCSQRDIVFEREHLFKHNIHFDINKNSKKIE